MAIPVFSGRHVEAAVTPERVVDAVHQRVRRLLARRLDDAAEGLRAGVPGGRLPRDAGARRRPRVARGRSPSLWDVDEERARRVADALGCTVAPSREEAFGADVVVTVTPGRDVL